MIITRSITGLVGKVEMLCGCYAEVAQGHAVLPCGTKHLSVHACNEWKRHKYDLAAAERDLAKRMIKWRKQEGQK